MIKGSKCSNRFQKLVEINKNSTIWCKLTNYETPIVHYTKYKVYNKLLMHVWLEGQRQPSKASFIRTRRLPGHMCIVYLYHTNFNTHKQKMRNGYPVLIAVFSRIANCLWLLLISPTPTLQIKLSSTSECKQSVIHWDQW